MLSVSCFKDKNGVYFNKKLIEGADPDTFKILEDSSYAEDKNQKYHLGMPVQK